MGANQRAERELMRAFSRLGNVLLAGALALAQQAPPSGSDTPAADAIGPKDLQSFSLNGTVTRAADQPAAAAPSPQRRQPRTQAQVAPSASQSAVMPAEAGRSASRAPAVLPPQPARTASAEPSRPLPSR